MRRVAIVGAGTVGMRSAGLLAESGWDVTVIEQNKTVGGLARSFPLNGASIECYYHFICGGDATMLKAIEELGLGNRLHWRLSRMGAVRQGRLVSTTSIVDMLRYPFLRPVERLRFMWATYDATRRADWHDLENVQAEAWLRATFGDAAYEVMWEPLMRHKFGPYLDKVSAAWIWARIKRVGASRTLFLKRERLGYLDGGLALLFDALTNRCRHAGARIHTGLPAERLQLRDGRVSGVVAAGRTIEADVVLTTVAAPELRNMVAGAADRLHQQLGDNDVLGVVCVLLLMRKALTPYFWINISDRNAPFPGIIEYSNLNPRQDVGGSVVYIPNYLAHDHPDWLLDDAALLERHCRDVTRILPGFRRDDVLAGHVFRDRWAQPVCECGFTRTMVPLRCDVPGLYATDATQLHPDDRNVSQLLAVAEDAVRTIREDHV